MMLPFQIIGIWLRGLLALAILGGGIFLLVRWFDAAHVANAAPGATAAQPGDPTPAKVGPNDAASPAASGSPSARHFEFHPGWNKPTAYLASAIALLLWGTLGNLIGQGAANLIKPRPKPGVDGPSDAPREERTGEVHQIDRPDGSKIRVECYGPPDAPPIICTHGWGGNSTSFFYPKLDLIHQYRLILWDEPGLGLSTRPANKDYSVTKFAHDLHAVLAFAGTKPAILVGHSIGGMIVLTYCRLYRETLRSRVAGLALVHTTYKDPVRTTKGAAIYTALEKPLLTPMMYVTIGLWPLFWALTWLSYLNGSLHRSTAKSSFAGTETRDQLNFCTAWTPHARPDIVARGMLGMMAYDETAHLAKINIPVLVVVGDQDSTTPPEAGQHIAETIPGAQLATLSPARHMGLIERHQTFDPLLARFSKACFAARAEI